MTRKHFNAIAEAFKAMQPGEYSDSGDRMVATATKFELANNIADKLAAENARFDRARFLAACGL